MTERPVDVRQWSRLEGLPEAQKLALSAVLVALGVVLGTFSIPIGPARVAPSQHFINVVAGMLVGPWYGVLTALAISIIRNALGTGTLLAFPGSVFGVFLVGVAYRWLRRPEAAFFEPIGTAIIGALVGYAIIAGLDNTVYILGFMKASPPSSQPYLGIFGGPLALIASFAVSSVPGSFLGYLAMLALRRAGIR